MALWSACAAPTPTSTAVDLSTPPPSPVAGTAVPPIRTALVASPPAGQPASPTPVRPQPTTPTAAASATPADPEAELAMALAGSPPKRDLLDLARRYRATPTPGAASPSPAATPAIGDVETFWVADSARKRYFQQRARLTRRSAHFDFYWLEGERPDEAGVQRSIDLLESRLLPTIVRYFGGSKIDVDRLRVTVLNVRTPGVVGYYSSVDEYPRWVSQFSNQRPLIVMNLGAVQPGTRGYDSGLAHELEHLIQFRLDPGEETWVNEGTAELAIRAVGLDASGNHQSFLQRPNTQLNHWAEEVGSTPAHYGAAFLFFSYLVDRFGGYEVVGDVLARPERGIAGIDPVLRGAAGAPDRSFDQIFRDWLVANWANQRGDDGRYGYKDLAQIRVNEEPIASVPTRVAAEVSQYAGRYYRLPKAAAGSLLKISAPPEVKLVGAPARDRPFWWSNRTDGANSRLTRTVDLTGVSRATLRFATWHDLERDYDYGFVAVSTDRGSTWRTLPGRTTTTTDPNGANVGNGFTGRSGRATGDSSKDGDRGGRWVDEEMDLTPFAGGPILLRFEMVTDDAYNGAGICFDAIGIPELGWQDAPGGAGWQAEGFVRIANLVPQRMAARVVAVTGRDVQVRDVPMGRDGRGSLRIPSEMAAADRLGLIVAAYTPLTIEAAPFEVTLERGE